MFFWCIFKSFLGQKKSNTLSRVGDCPDRGLPLGCVIRAKVFLTLRQAWIQHMGTTRVLRDPSRPQAPWRKSCELKESKSGCFERWDMRDLVWFNGIIMGDEMEEGGIPYEEQWIHMHPYTLSLSLFSYIQLVSHIFWYRSDDLWLLIFI